MTHDSIGLGEDGPTHQPIEHIAALRAIPNLDVIRPADANEVSIAWREILRRKAPSGLLLSRQNLPVLDRTRFNSAEGAARGAYALNDENNPDLILIATGSEVALAVSAYEVLEDQGVKVRLVSAPCLEWFKEQPDSYKEELLPSEIKARLSIEAGIAQGWRDLIGDSGESISIDHFGASASHTTLFKEFGFTVERVVEAAHATLKRVR